jgi:hypothetical protein
MWLYLLDKPKWWSDSGVFTGVCRKVSPTYECKILDILSPECVTSVLGPCGR